MNKFLPEKHMISIKKFLSKKVKYINYDSNLISFLYKGITVFCAPDTSLLNQLKDSRDIYERELFFAISKCIKRKKEKRFLDIGANIGLITFPLVSMFKDLKVYAIEPGPLQFKHLEASVRYNSLQEKVIIFNMAITDYSGSTDFYIHDAKDASGDGIIDTERSGHTKKIKVKASTLDDWWSTSGKEQIDVVKIDVEGAELNVLSGAGKFINSCRPTIFIEIFPDNIRHYKYSVSDINNWFAKNNYKIESIDGKVTLSDKNTFDWTKYYNFIAYPL